MQNQLINILLFFVLLSPTSLSSQCHAPFILLECYGPLDLNLIETNQQRIERQISQWGWDNYNEKQETEIKNFLTDPNYEKVLDSIFGVVKKYLIDRVGEAVFCQQVEFNGISVSHRSYKKDRIAGRLSFNFFFDPINCWNGPGSRFYFSFEGLETGGYNITFPNSFPTCILEGRKPELHSNASIIRRAFSLGLIDGTEDMACDKVDHNRQSLIIRGSLYEQRHLTFDANTGALLTDTLHTPYLDRLRGLNTFREIVDASTLIVDATGIKTEEFKGLDGQTHGNHFYKIHHVLKGDKTKEDFVLTRWLVQTTHSHPLPGPGTRCLFFLKEKDQEYHEKIGNPLLQNDYNIQSLVISPNTLVAYSKANLYMEVFPKIAKLADIKIKAHDNINNTDEETKKWLIAKGKTELYQKQGTLIGLNRLFWRENNKKLKVDLFMTGTKDFSYLLCKEFLIEYDTSFVSPFAVKENVLSISRLYSASGSGKDRIPSALLSENYNITITDVTFNTVKIKIEAKKKENLAQITPRFKSRNLHSHILAELSFKVKDNPSSNSFSVKLLNEPFKKTGKYYDPLRKKKKRYAYQRSIKPVIKTTLGHRIPIVEKVVPLSYSIGDTITIYGQNLETFKDQVYMTCSAVVRDIYMKRHCSVPSRYIISTEDSVLKFVVPEEFAFNKDGIGMMVPASGTVKVRYGQSEEVLEYMGE